ncbi:MAG: hypothetical protein WBQ50_10775 [Nocardioides sp.]
MSRAVSTTGTPSAGRALVRGAVAGVVASLVMAMYAMGAAWVEGTGFFTPLHHIASLWAPQESMMTSMQEATSGNDFQLSAGTALLGAVIHMMTGAMYGAVFGLVVSRLRLGRGAQLVVGVGYGGLVFLASAFVGLPLAAAIFDAGDPISNMAEMAGWWTFAIEHLLFGLALGALAARAHQHADTPLESAAPH